MDCLSSPSERRYFGRITHGLEEVAWRDLSCRLSAKIIKISHRTIEFSSGCESEKLLALRSLEDIFLHLGEIPETSHTREGLSAFKKFSRELERERFLNESVMGYVNAEVTFSCTASFLGKRNYSRWEIAEAFAAPIVERFKWRYVDLGAAPRESSTLHFRIHIDQTRTIIGVRVGVRPLYKRAYKRFHAPGSLNPCVAYLMTCLASEHGEKNALLDPACGTGTIPLEAAAAGWKRVVGADIAYRTLMESRMNAVEGDGIGLVCASVHALPLVRSSFDAIVTDVPWGRQTSLKGVSSTWGLRDLVRDFRELMSQSGRWVLLVEDASEIEKAVRGEIGLSIVWKKTISLYGRHPTLLVISG